MERRGNEKVVCAKYDVSLNKDSAVFVVNLGPG
jgi:hypothetical protein